MSRLVLKSEMPILAPLWEQLMPSQKFTHIQQVTGTRGRRAEGFATMTLKKLRGKLPSTSFERLCNAICNSETLAQ